MEHLYLRLFPASKEHQVLDYLKNEGSPEVLDDFPIRWIATKPDKGKTGMASYDALKNDYRLKQEFRKLDRTMASFITLQLKYCGTPRHIIRAISGWLQRNAGMNFYTETYESE